MTPDHRRQLATNLLSGVRCTVCHGERVVRLAHIPAVPVLCNVLWPSSTEAKGVRRVAMQLGFCGTCGHVFNSDFDPQLLDYSQAYENSLHFSPRFQQYADELAQDLIERHDLHQKRIIEIGSGKGDFLRMLCGLGDNRGIGFDPSYVPDPTDHSSGAQIEFVEDFYSEKYIDCEADFIYCRHTLEHIDDPVAFMEMVRRAIGQRDITVFFEVPNGLFTLRDMAVWDIIYEHCSYFTALSLANLFARTGFRVTRLQTAFDGQYLLVEGKPVPIEGDPPDVDWRNPDELLEDVVGFSTRYAKKAAADQASLTALRQGRQRTVVWGAGSKGVTFLNTLPGAEVIEYVVDINPRKQGMHISGTGQQIVAPDFLRQYRPDAVIVMNPIYLREIEQTLAEMGLNPTLITA